MEFNIIDYFICGIAVLSLISGFRQGFIKALGGIIGIVAGFILALTYYDNLAFYLEDYYGIITLLADFLRERFPFASFPVAQGFMVNPDLLRLGSGDIAYFLAAFFVLGLSFLLLFLVLSKMVQFIWNLLDQVFMVGILSWLNRLSGMIVVLIKNMIIISVILGIFFPWLKAGADIGVPELIVLKEYINDSFLANKMLTLFENIKSMIVFKV
ncbi:CvpA family protein [Thermosyntropha sp.]|uniref:CvpA family protein n=1 Tax=Thermosyntropha sp. TaxID=2740820 RepID=UPI0025E149B4|nr:CvpA family protein [Thermosyntropha sp.]MBO8159653.1 CvpA family protein [Thermosyntropha sp.]